MRKTPLEIASAPHEERLDWILTATEPRELHELFRHAAVMTHSGDYFVATNGIRILVAESQAKSAEKLERQTDALIKLTAGLYRLTWGLVILTAGLLILTVRLVVH